jgi:phosphate starvation-inducible protein PhoH
MQNATPSQMKMLLTRLGEGSRMVVTGDLNQADRPRENGLLQFCELYGQGGDYRMIAMARFETKDIEREEVIKEILDIYAGNVPQHYIEDRTPSSSETSVISEKESDIDSNISD